VAAVLVILAHQGGWDEMLMVAGPIVLFALILRAANRRAERRAAELDGSGPEAEAIEDQSRTSTSAPNDASRPGRSS
jgi:hypothetical protein